MCVWPGWEVGVGSMKGGSVSLPSGKLVSQLATCNQEARLLHKYPDTGVLSCQALSKGCLEERSPVAQNWLPGSLGLYT